MRTYKSLKANKTYSLLLLLFVSEAESLCTLGWSEVHSVDQAGPKLRSACLCCLHAEIRGVHHSAWSVNLFFLDFFLVHM